MNMKTITLVLSEDEANSLSSLLCDTLAAMENDGRESHQIPEDEKEHYRNLDDIYKRLT